MKIYKINGYKWKNHDEWCSKSRRFKKIPLLQKILHKKLIKMITLTCRDGFEELPNFEKSKLELRNYFSQLPATVRTSLLDKILTRNPWEEVYGHETYPRKLYYSEVFFSLGVSMIHFRGFSHIEACHMNSILKLLSEEGNNLQVLILHGIWNPRKVINECLLAKVLFTAAKLNTLNLPQFCNDSILKLIGENCNRLQKLVIPYSSVSHKGLTFLTQNIVKHDVKQDCKSEHWNSALWPFPNIFLPFHELIPDGECWEFYGRQKSPLCDTLKVLETQIYTMDKDKYTGLLMLLELVKNLEDFKNIDFKHFFQMLGSELTKNKMENIQLPDLNLSRIYTSTMDEKIFQLTQRLCPKLRHLVIRDITGGGTSSVPISNLNCFFSLDTLTSYNTPYVDKDISSLVPQIRERLTMLTLFNKISEDPFNLNVISQMPHLRNLTLSYTIFTWESQEDEYLQKYCNLSNVSLWGKVTQKCLIKLLECAPNLEDLRIHSVVDRTKDFVKRLCNIRKTPKLKALMMYQGYFLQKKEELVYFLTCYSKLKTLIRIPLQMD